MARDQDGPWPDRPVSIHLTQSIQSLPGAEDWIARGRLQSLDGRVLAAGNDTELAILIMADGARPDVLRALAKSGEIPHLAGGLLAESYDYEGVTVLPSVSNVGYVPMLTGQYPGTANVPGVRWVDKSKFTSGRLLLQGHRSYMAPSHLKLNGDLSPDLETIFELNPDSLAVRCDVKRGLSAENNSFSHAISMPFMFLAHYLRRGDFVDRIAMAQAMKSLARTDGRRPRFIFLPLVDVDKVSHSCGPEHRRTIDAYKRIDALVGTMLDWLRKHGLWDRTHLMLTSDHGHTKTGQHLDISTLLSELGYSVFEHPNVYRRSASAAVMISGNSFANLYFSSQGRWEAPLTSGEIEEEHGAALQAIRRREEVEWCAYRHRDGAVKIASRDGEAVLDLQEEHYTYGFDGVDPLRLPFRHSRVARSEALARTIETDFPDSLEQIWHLFKSQRTGDIIVTAKLGYDLRGWREFPEHRSSHGALCRGHMAVPMLSNRPLVSDGGIRTVDLFSTVAEGLGLTPTKPHFGRSLL